MSGSAGARHRCRPQLSQSCGVSHNYLSCGVRHPVGSLTPEINSDLTAPTLPDAIGRYLYPTKHRQPLPEWLSTPPCAALKAIHEGAGRGVFGVMAWGALMLKGSDKRAQVSGSAGARHRCRPQLSQSCGVSHNYLSCGVRHPVGSLTPEINSDMTAPPLPDAIGRYLYPTKHRQPLPEWLSTPPCAALKAIHEGAGRGVFGVMAWGALMLKGSDSG
ncbi:hypothetical protein Bpet0812 [Bordetella petrii]|uniref:Uncharacterized protein n=1 Tax=Bordetella petrii (strain ATCC BAA-461 / DSM 12804 / CCUG 43448 / CIP 107267 / Se-1111R) TaxID=340100 RepID=A9I5W0_BORPD|nr:hypothetical protein Bpet0812 [Bordetella petrii]